MWRQSFLKTENHNMDKWMDKVKAINTQFCGFYSIILKATVVTL